MYQPFFNDSLQILLFRSLQPDIQVSGNFGKLLLIFCQFCADNGGREIFLGFQF